MNKICLSILSFFCLLTVQTIGAVNYARCSEWGQSLLTNVNFQIGYRYDDFNWNIGIPVTGPNILSELKWQDLNIFQIGGEAILTHPNCFYMRGNVYYGWVLSGDCLDFDFFGDNRTDEFSRSISDASGGYVGEMTIGIGRTYYHCDGHFALTPLIGYSFHTQHLRMHDGRQIVPFEGEIPGLDATYTTRWNSIWTGVDLGIDSCLPWDFLFSYELHYAWLRGRGHWNLRSEFFRDFLHFADGVGQVIRARAGYQVSSCFNFNLEAKFQGWYLCGGNERVFFINDENQEVEARVALNRVNWTSLSIMVGTEVTF